MLNAQLLELLLSANANCTIFIFIFEKKIVLSYQVYYHEYF